MTQSGSAPVTTWGCLASVTHPHLPWALGASLGPSLEPPPGTPVSCHLGLLPFASLMLTERDMQAWAPYRVRGWMSRF